MKTYLIIMLMFFLAQNSFGQDISIKPRTLKLISDQENCTVERLKKNKKGEIIRLEQTTLIRQKDTLIRIAESYKKNKFWKIWTIRNIIHSEKDIIKEPEDYYIIKRIDDRMQELDQDGKIDYESLYFSNNSKSKFFSYYYYPNGNLKLVTEEKDGNLWNIITFRNIDGSKHDYGYYKNGSGSILWLNDKGEPCLECFFKDNQVIKKINNCD